MAATLKDFDQKIEELKNKKKELEKKQAQQLLKHISSTIGDSFSPQLAACIIEDVWTNASKDQKEKWIKSAEKFQLSKPRKPAKAA